MLNGGEEEIETQSSCRESRECTFLVKSADPSKPSSFDMLGVPGLFNINPQDP